MKFTVIGTGNMGKALINGFLTSGMIKPEELCVFDIRKDAADKVASDYGCTSTDDVKTAVEGADYVLMAVKPQHFDNALGGLMPYVKADAAIISIAAAVKVARIEKIAGSDRKIFRVMPNTPAQVGSGVSAVVPVRIEGEQKDFLINLFETCGIVIECDEKTLDVIGCVSGTGPAYVMLFIEAMADAAVKHGIPRADALKIAEATVMGSGKLAFETGTHPAVLKDMVCSPGGTTIAGVAALEEAGLRNAVIKSVDAAYDRTVELATGK
ncbi:MAG: pyrroline-5-carboxylate reductase [Clostridiales bacterium]|nr:pyrroline-5-carboxylate reductase [Clostridiales bacterium]